MEPAFSVNPGLCGTCVHARRIESAHGSVFLLCGLSYTDSRFRRYPPLPVLACAGYLVRSESGSAADADDPETE